MNPNRRLAVLAMSSVLASMMTGCGGGGDETITTTPPPPPPTSGRPTSVERNVLPATADSQVTTALEAHVAINPSASVAPVNKLFVFLPGTGGTPDMYRLILRAGATRGYHTLGLNYPDDEAVGVTCAAQSTSCYWDVRREVITGTSTSSLVSVSVPDSIVTRLTKVLTYLNTTYPTEGWGQYVSGGAPVWANITVAGHSQGGGHAGVMAKLYSLNRAVYFASPPDWSGSAPAAWTGFSNVTAASKQYAFTNVDDTLVSYSDLTAIWAAMSLSGPAVSVDSNAAPYSSSHILTTTATPRSAGVTISPTHGATVLDAATPLTSSGAPVYDAAWAYLCFP